MYKMEHLILGIGHVFDKVDQMTNPTSEERAEFFRPAFEAATKEPEEGGTTTATGDDDHNPEELPVVPLADCRQLTEKEEKRLRRKEDAKLRELRIFLR